MQWEAVDDTSAGATLEDDGIVLTMTFHFNAEGLIKSVRADARGRTVGGSVIPTPWEGRYRDYQSREGMLIPVGGGSMDPARRAKALLAWPHFQTRIRIPTTRECNRSTE